MSEKAKFTKLEKAKWIVRSIIQLRIRNCGIITNPYADSATYEGFKRAIRKVVLDIKREEQTRRVPDWDCFKVKYNTVDGVRDWYIEFNLDKWDAEWKKIKELEGKA